MAASSGGKPGNGPPADWFEDDWEEIWSGLPARGEQCLLTADLVRLATDPNWGDEQRRQWVHVKDCVYCHSRYDSMRVAVRAEPATSGEVDPGTALAELATLFRSAPARRARPSEGSPVRVFDLAEGTPVAECGRRAEVRFIAHSPDGRHFATGGRSGKLAVWESHSARMVHELSAHRREVNCAAFAPSGGRLISGGGDAAVRVWDLATGRNVGQLEGHAGAVTALACSPDGTFLASCDSVGRIVVWDLPNGRLSRVLTESGPRPKSLAFADQGQRLICQYPVPRPTFTPPAGTLGLAATVALQGANPSADGISDEQLWEAFLRGDTRSINRLYRRYRGRLYAEASRYVEDPRCAGEVVRQVFAALVQRRLLSLPAPAVGIQAWLEKALSIQLHARKPRASEERIKRSLLGEPNRADRAKVEKLHHRLQLAVHELDEDQAELINTHFYDEPKVRGGGSLMGVFNERLRQALARLRRLMRPQAGRGGID